MTTTSKTTTQSPKASIVKQAAWAAVLDAVVIISDIILLAKQQMTFSAEDYAAPIPVPFLLSIIPMVFLIVFSVLTVIQTRNAEKDDELSKLNRYKAGRISLYIFITIIVLILWFVPNIDLSFMTDSFGRALLLPTLLLLFAQFLENLTFIVLEKRGLK